MLDSVLIPDWKYPVFFTVVIIGVIMIASVFIIEEYRYRKEQENLDNNDYHVVKDKKIDLDFIGMIGIILVLFSPVFGLVYSSIRDHHVNNAIVNDIKETYDVNIYDHEGSQEGSPFVAILDNNPVPVFIEHEGTYYDNTYVITYNENEDKAELHLSQSNAPVENVPIPEDLENQSR